MQPTTLTLHSGFRIDVVDPRIFGGFLEHMGRAVYEGVYDPESPLADAGGWRTDVLEKLAGSGAPDSPSQKIVSGIPSVGVPSGAMPK